MIPGHPLLKLLFQTGGLAAIFGLMLADARQPSLVPTMVLFAALASIALAHEAGHFAVARALKAAPAWATDRLAVYSWPVYPRHQRLISAAGPVTGSLVGLAALSVSFLLQRPVLQVAILTATLPNLFMLLPVFSDGALLFMKKETFHNGQT